jgi:hypothetical protein
MSDNNKFVIIFNNSTSENPLNLQVVKIDIDKLFVVREEESNVVSASPITFGRRLWGRGERKLTPKQLATLADTILTELPLFSKYGRVFQR